MVHPAGSRVGLLACADSVAAQASRFPHTVPETVRVSYTLALQSAISTLRSFTRPA